MVTLEAVVAQGGDPEIVRRRDQGAAGRGVRLRPRHRRGPLRGRRRSSSGCRPAPARLSRRPCRTKARQMPIKIPADPPRPRRAPARGRDGDVRGDGAAPGHPPPADRPPQPDAQEGADRDPVRPGDRRDAPADRAHPDPHVRAPVEEHLRRAPRGFLPAVPRGPRAPLRRPHHHRRTHRAPDFEAVGYWDELREVFDWTQTNVHSTMGVCWGGMAMLHHFHGIPKHMLPAKAFGCFRHLAVEPSSQLLQGFSDSFVVPVSRWTEVRDEDLSLHPDLRVLIHSEDVGPCLDRGPPPPRLLHVQPPRVRIDHAQGRVRPRHWPPAATSRSAVDYFPDDDPACAPENRWRSLRSTRSVARSAWCSSTSTCSRI